MGVGFCCWWDFGRGEVDDGVYDQDVIGACPVEELLCLRDGCSAGRTLSDCEDLEVEE